MSSLVHEEAKWRANSPRRACTRDGSEPVLQSIEGHQMAKHSLGHGRTTDVTCHHLHQDISQFLAEAVGMVVESAQDLLTQTDE